MMDYRRQPSPAQQPLAKAFSSLLLRAIRSPLSFASSFNNRRFVFSFLVVSVLSAKAAHLSTHLSSLSPRQLIPWSCSFFVQDFLLLLLTRLLLGDWLFSKEKSWKSWKLFVQGIVGCFIFITASLGVMTVSFFAATGSQIHWRNAAFAGGDAASRALMLSGIVYFIVILGVVTITAWLLRNITYGIASHALDVLAWPLKRALHKEGSEGWVDEQYSDKYSQIAQDDDDIEDAVFQPGAGKLGVIGTQPRISAITRFGHVLLGTTMTFLVLTYIFRPHESAMAYLSWTVIILPILELASTAPALGGIFPVYGPEVNRMWDAPSAMGRPIALPWLPKEPASEGFDDWYKSDRQHYQARLDPLKISNLDSPLLPQLQNMLKNVPIRHVMVIKLESTRKDVFPIKKDGLIWNRFANTFTNNTMPEAAVERLQTLTPIANYLTGDYDDGFDHSKANRSARGGLNFNDAYTTCTYTLKSLTSTMCGVSPLLVDFNKEYNNHIYQPCLPQILDTLNAIGEDRSSTDATGSSSHNSRSSNSSSSSSSSSNNHSDFTSYKWKSTFMQSVTLDFDKFDKLIPALGFPDDRIIDKGYLKSSRAKFGIVNLPDVNYFGMAETPLKDYIHDAFSSAKKNNERVFLTHITSTSHHPYGMPSSEKYVPLADGLEDLSKYVNSIGFDDRWLGQVLDILDNEGVANETLVVFVGDHGLSIPENDILASYYNANVGCNKVPLVLSHPLLPAITIENAVTNIQILPTILDLLLETSSLAPVGSRAVRDLLANYEGQSMIRPLRNTTQGNGVITSDRHPHPDWQFTVVNPGYNMVGVRDSTHQYWRMVVPVLHDQEWQFTDIKEDPRESHGIKGFDFYGFIKKIEENHGIEAAKWAEAGAFAARWFVDENHKRWLYKKD